MNKNWQQLINLLSHDKNLSEEAIIDSLKEAIVNYYAKEKQILDKENITIIIDDEIKVQYQEQSEVLNYNRRMVQILEQNFQSIMKKNEKNDFLYSLTDNLCQFYVGKVKAIKKDGIIIDYKNYDLFLFRKEMLENEFYKPGQNISFTIIEGNDGDEYILTRKNEKLAVEWLKKEVVEVEEGLIKVIKVARLPGKITAVVLTAKNGIDPIRTIVKKAKLEAWSSINYGEKIKLLKEQSLTDTIINAFKNVEIDKIMVDDEEQLVEVISNNQTDQHQQLQDIIALLFDYNLQFYTEAEWQKKEEKNYQFWLKEAGVAGISEEIATILFNNNIGNFEDLAKNNEEIEEIENEELLILKNIAKNHLNQKWQEDFDEKEIAKLNKSGIKKLQDLADLAFDELQEITPMDDKRAKEIIIKSRKKVFGN